MENLTIGSPVISDTGEYGFILDFTESKDFAKIRYYEAGKSKFRHFDVKRLTKINLLPVRDDLNRLAVEPYNSDFLHAVAAKLKLKREYCNGHFYKVPAHERRAVYGACLRVSVNTLQSLMLGAKVERQYNDQQNVKALKLVHA